jgi:hypothetical protein
MPRRDRASERTPTPMREQFANMPDVIGSDRPALPSETGREEGLAEDERLSDFEAEVQSHPVGGRPMSDITGRREPGSTNETVDGLDETEEAVRREAEDRPVGTRRN